MNRYAASVRRLKLQERILPLRMLNMYNWAFAIATDCGEADASFPSVVPGICQVRTGTCRTDILQRTYHPAWRCPSGHCIPSC